MGQGRNWTKEEEQFLSDNWGQMSVPGLCKKLNRSKNAIGDILKSHIIVRWRG